MEIKPYPKNAKKHPQKQIDQLALIVKEVGWRQPILVNQQGTIIAGHGRWETYQQNQDLGEPWVIDDAGKTIMGEPASTPLTTEQEMAYRLADNKLAETDVDMGLVIEELKELEALGELAPLTGYDMDLTIEADEADDEVPDVPEEPRSKLGDLYELGSHRVLCGDSTSLDDFDVLMQGRKADMWLTDPPYNVDYTGKTKDSLKIENDKMKDGDFRSFLVDCYTAADANMKPGAVFYIWHADSEGYNFRGAAHDIGWKVRQCLIWNKQTMVMGRQDYHWKHEPCLYGWKEGTHLWATDRKQTTVLNFDRPSKSEFHPTMKPVELIAYQLTNNTKQQDIVLDSFLGSGSTLIAAEKTGRVCYGMELDPRYISVILDRWQQYTGKDPILKETAEPSDPRKGLAWSVIKSSNPLEIL